MSAASLLPAMILVIAQPPAPGPGSKLDSHLAAWEKAAAGVSRIRVEIELTRTEAVFKKKHEYSGSLLFMKPNLFVLRLAGKKNPSDWEAYICDGKSIYAYDGLGKTITEIPLGGGNRLAAMSESPVFALLGGPKSSDVTKRFALDLTGEDANYVYLKIKPTQAKDQQEFAEAMLALYGPKVPAPGIPYIPAMIRVTKPNGDMETWMLKGHVINPKIDEKAFAPREEAGFTRKKYPR